VVAHFVPKVNMQRITFTFGLINAARCVIFLVAGASKAIPLAQVLGMAPMPAVLPSALAKPASGELIWLVDRAAYAV
jgi:6-phosphogluconolactonase